MKPRLHTLLTIAATAIFGGLPLPFVSAADRNIDTNVVYPTAALIQNGGRILNVTNPPSGVTKAQGDGTVDDTPAFKSAYDYIKNAFVASKTNSYIIYVPNGTYRVTSTIIYNGTTDAAMNNVRFVGQSRAGAIIKLDSNSPGFQSASAPAAVLQYQYPTGGFNNTATSNLCENLTINTGSGNPGVAGIRFQGANSARMANVTVASGDGSGYCGVWLKTGSIQAYLKDITITGFNYGIVSLENNENDTAWEHVSINNPTTAAIYMEGGGLAMRDLDLNQSTLHVPAVQFAGTGACCWLLDSHLNGGNSSFPAVIVTSAQQELFARNVTVSGYTVAVQNQGATAVAGPFISEYTAHPVNTLFTLADQHSFAELVLDTPTVAWQTNLNDWYSVNAYGAKGDGTTDDSTAIQAAFTAAGGTAGSVVYFPSLNYKITKAITVPASVTRVDLLFGNIAGGTFSVNAASSNPVIFVGKGGCNITINAARPVIAEFCGGNVVNQQSAAVDTYLESCTGYGSGSEVCTAAQSVWARCINDELSSGNDIECNGGTMWVLGYKTENKPCISFYCVNGGYAEVIGGFVNCTTSPGSTPMLQVSDANLSYTGFTGLGGNKFATTISETQGSTNATAAPSVFPLRGGTYSTDIVIPLYIAGERPSDSFGIFTGSQDIGSVNATGSTSSYSSLTYPTDTTPGTYFVDGSGVDIWGTADSFQFVTKTISSNTLTLIAKVDAIDDTNTYAKAGVMFRSSTAANSPFVAVLVEPAAGIILESRATAGASATGTTQTSLRPPYWVKLQRTGASSFTGYASADGSTWTTIGTATVSLPESVLAGLSVSSHNNGAVTRAIIEGVSLTNP